WSSDTRPKSIATVVVVLFGVRAVSSMPTEASVMTASVVSGMISETAPTKVVLPTPNPPATTIFVEVSTPPPPPPRLEPAKSTEHPLQQVQIRLAGVKLRLIHVHKSLGRHVRDQNPRDAQWYAEHRRDLSHRPHLTAQR